MYQEILKIQIHNELVYPNQSHGGTLLVRAKMCNLMRIPPFASHEDGNNNENISIEDVFMDSQIPFLAILSQMISLVRKVV